MNCIRSNRNQRPEHRRRPQRNRNVDERHAPIESELLFVDSWAPKWARQLFGAPRMYEAGKPGHYIWGDSTRPGLNVLICERTTDGDHWEMNVCWERAWDNGFGFHDYGARTIGTTAEEAADTMLRHIIGDLEHDERRWFWQRRRIPKVFYDEAIEACATLASVLEAGP